MDIVRNEAGGRYADLELSSLSILRLTHDVPGVIETLATQMRTTPEVVAAMPGALVGSRRAIVDKLHANRDRWDISYPVVSGAVMDAMAPIVAELAGT
jgi:hypothetical protein